MNALLWRLCCVALLALGLNACHHPAPIYTAPNLGSSAVVTVPVVLRSLLRSGDGSATGANFATLTEIRTRQGTVPAGALVNVRITEARARRIGRPGMLHLELVETRTLEGRPVPLQGSAEIRGRSKKGKAVGLALGFLPILYVPSLFFLMVKGGEASVDPGFIIYGAVGNTGQLLPF